MGFAEIDLFARPSIGWPVSALPRDSADQAVSSLLRFTAPFNFSGSPTISLPCGFDTEGLPVSMQLVGRHLGETTLVGVRAAFERVTSWHDRHLEC